MKPLIKLKYNFKKNVTTFFCWSLICTYVLTKCKKYPSHKQNPNRIGDV